MARANRRGQPLPHATRGQLWFLLAHMAFQHRLQRPRLQLPRAQQYRRDSFDVSRQPKCRNVAAKDYATTVMNSTSMAMSAHDYST